MIGIVDYGDPRRLVYVMTGNRGSDIQGTLKRHMVPHGYKVFVRVMKTFLIGETKVDMDNKQPMYRFYVAGKDPAHVPWVCKLNAAKDMLRTDATLLSKFGPKALHSKLKNVNAPLLLGLKYEAVHRILVARFRLDVCPSVFHGNDDYDDDKENGHLSGIPEQGPGKRMMPIEAEPDEEVAMDRGGDMGVWLAWFDDALKDDMPALLFDIGDMGAVEVPVYVDPRFSEVGELRRVTNGDTVAGMLSE